MNEAERRIAATVVVEVIKDALSLYAAEREGGADEAKAREAVLEEIMPDVLDELDALTGQPDRASEARRVEDGEAPNLDDLVALAASRGSGLKTCYAGTAIEVTPRAVQWALREVCRRPRYSMLHMLAFHARRRAMRTNFRAYGAESEETVVLQWRGEEEGRRLSLVMAFADELGDLGPTGEEAR